MCQSGLSTPVLCAYVDIAVSTCVVCVYVHIYVKSILYVCVLAVAIVHKFIISTCMYTYVYASKVNIE